MTKHVSVVVLVGVLGLACNGWADSYTVSLNVKGDVYDGNIGNGPWGSVVLTLDNGKIDVTVNGNAEVDIGRTSGGATDIFGFNYTGSDPLAITVPSGESHIYLSTTNTTIDQFGKFDYVLALSSQNAHTWDPLTFTVSRQNGSFTSVYQLLQLSTGATLQDVDFAAQVVNCWGFVGGGTVNSPPAPEPGSLLLLGTGIVAAAFWIRRRRAWARS